MLYVYSLSSPVLKFIQISFRIIYLAYRPYLDWPESESLHKLRLDSSALSMFSSSLYHLLSPLLVQTHTHPFLTGPMPLQGGQYSASDFCTRSFGRKFCPGSANISCIGWKSGVRMVRDMFSKPRRFSDSHRYSKTFLLFVVCIGVVNLYDMLYIIIPHRIDIPSFSCWQLLKDCFYVCFPLRMQHISMEVQ